MKLLMVDDMQNHKCLILIAKEDRSAALAKKPLEDPRQD